MMRAACAAFFFVCACDDEPSVIIGDDASAPDVATSACAVTGSWMGTIDHISFPSGSGAVAFVIMPNGGTLTFGSAPAPPAPTDPNAAYPPGLTIGQLEEPMPIDYVEGFPYAIETEAFDGTTLTFAITAEQVFQAYCALQPETWGDGTDGGAPYACLPPWGFFCNGQTEICVSTNPNDSSQTITYSVEKQDLCSSGGTCVCDATSCNAIATADVTFVLTCSATGLEGTIAGALGNHDVQVTKP